MRWTLLLGLAGLAAAVPVSSPDGTGMQWDELVLAAVAGSAAWTTSRRVRSMTPAAARPWQVIAVGAALFAVGQLLVGAFPGPAFDGFGIDDVFTLGGAVAPLVTGAMLTRRVSRSRLVALVVDGAMVTAALLVVTEVVRTPLVNPAGAPDDLRSLVLVYGGFAAVVLGAGSALCTVSTPALRRSATVLLGAVALQAVAASCEAMAIVAPSPLWTAGSDLAVALALQATVLAGYRAPDRHAEGGPRAAAPLVSPIGVTVVVGALLALPAAFAISLLENEPLTPGALLGAGAVFTLMAVRRVQRIREDVRVTEDLLSSEERFAELVESTSDGVTIVDDALHLLFASPLARELLDLPAGAVTGLDLSGLVDAEDRARATAALAEPDVEGLHFHVGAGDTRRELEATYAERHPVAGRRVLYLRDVTSRRLRERELERMAYTDHLTGIPNRALLFRELTVDVPRTRSLLVVDLDGFKAVNDRAGHEAGDLLLIEVGRRLHTVVRAEDLVARLGGDEFAVLVAGDLTEAAEVAQRIVDALSLPYRADGMSFAVGASVGAAPVGRAGGQAAFREADAALRAAKQAGKGCVRLAGPASVAPGPDGDPDLAAALAAGLVRLRYDVVAAADGRPVQVDAVPVWEHPVRGRITGAELWALAERQGGIADLQRFRVNTSVAEIAPLDRLGLALSLMPGEPPQDGIAPGLGALLAAHGMAPSRLTLAFTEELLLTSSVDLLPAIEAVRELGIHLCLSDYGMGQSLFALLARMPFDAVRVDVASLVARDTDRGLRVLAAILRTTGSFGLITVADRLDHPDLRDAALAAGVQYQSGRVVPHDLTVAELAALLVPPVPALQP